MIADGHHRYEAALAFASRSPVSARPACSPCSSPATIRVSVSSQRIGSRHAEIAPVDAALGAVDEAYEALLDLPYDTAAAIVCTAAGAWIVHGDPGQFDTELVERVAGPSP